MKWIVLVALTVACALAFLERADANATTESVDKELREPKESAKDAVRAAKEAKKGKKDCVKECGTEYDPICVHDPNDANFKPRTFGTQCALDVHNCEMGTKLVAKNKGECPGSGGTRLS